MTKISKTGLAFLIGLGVASHAQVAGGRSFEVEAGEDRIQAVLPSLAPGDTILLVSQAGVYRESAALELPAMPLKILARDGVRPTLKSLGTSQMRVQGDLYIEGIRFDGAKAVEYGIVMDADPSSSLRIEGCEFTGHVKAAVTDSGRPFESCVVKNSLFYDIGQVAISFKSKDVCRNLVVENSTFYGLGESAVSLVEGDQALSARINHVTVYDSYDGIVLTSVNDSRISETILADCRGKSVRTGPDGRVASTCLYRSSGSHDHVEGAVCLNCIGSDPAFYDARAGDFSLLPESPCLWVGEGQQPVGDRRWSGPATTEASRRRRIDRTVKWSAGIGGAMGAILLLFGVGRWHTSQKTSRQIRERDARYRAVLEASKDGIALVDPESHYILEMNASFVSQFGLNLPLEPEIVFDELLDERDKLADLYDSALNARFYRGQHSVKRSTGAAKHLEIVATPMDYQGRPIACVVARDTTELMYQTTRLVEAEERLRYLLRSSPAVLYSRDPSDLMGFTFLSESIERLLGFAPEEMISDSEFFKWRIHMEDLPRVMGEQPRVLRGGTVTLEYRVQHKDGSYLWIRDESYLVRDEAGLSSEIVGSIMDITSRLDAEHRRMAAEKELDESEERFRSVVEHAADAIFVVGSDGRFLDANQQAYRSLGYERDELLALSVPDVQIKLTTEEFEKMQKQVMSGVTVTKDGFHRRKDGTTFPVEVRIGSLYLDGRPRLLALARDVTERKRTEEAKERAEQELEAQKALSIRADRLRSLGEMAAGIAHELNQPLVGVRGLAEHILIGLDRGWNLTKEKLQDRAERIVEQADRMVHIIDHVRMFAREAGKPELESIQVNEVVKSGMEMIGAQFMSRGVLLSSDLGEDLPEVEANPFSLEEVLLNLLSNARDAVESCSRDNGSDPEVIIRTGLEIGRSNRVFVQVQDNGTGIPPQVLERVFDPFFTTKEPDKGTGLGLSISRSIVEDFDGEMKIETGEGNGTTVSILLPTKKA